MGVNAFHSHSDSLAVLPIENMSKKNYIAQRNQSLWEKVTYIRYIYPVCDIWGLIKSTSGDHGCEQSHSPFKSTGEAEASGTGHRNSLLQSDLLDNQWCSQYALKLRRPRFNPWHLVVSIT